MAPPKRNGVIPSGDLDVIFHAIEQLYRFPLARGLVHAAARANPLRWESTDPSTTIHRVSTTMKGKDAIRGIEMQYSEGSLDSG